ncbi:hypothetical protein V1291_002042 [Nitrobacteraceae bacterium AZCC 1564]
MASRIEKFRVVAFSKFEAFSDVGFALPIFALVSDPSRSFVQKLDEFGRYIVSFEELGEASDSETVLDGPTAGVGEEPIYVFLGGHRGVENVRAVPASFLCDSLS